MPRWTVFDAAAVAIAALLTVVAVADGLATGWSVVDVDEAVYRDTLVAMRAGEGYYPAMRDALVAKEGQPPTSVRAIRPPALYLALRPFPPGSWRWLVGIPFLAITLAAWRLARPFGAVAGPLAALLAGRWVNGFTTFLFLHAEVWAVPAFLAGLLAVRRGRDGQAAAWMAVAAAVREPFALGLVLGLVLRRRRRPWAAALGVLGVAAVIHAALAERVLSERGYEARFGNEDLTWDFVLRLVSPGGGRTWQAFGVLFVVAGMAGLVKAFRLRDPAAAVALPFAGAVLVAAVLATRVYWSAMWAPVLAAFVPAVLGRRWGPGTSPPPRLEGDPGHPLAGSLQAPGRRRPSR